MNKLGKFFTLIVTFLTFSNAQATIINLDGNNIRYTGVFIEGDFKISAPVGLVNGSNLSARDHLTAIGFSGDYMETWNTQAVFNLEHINGAHFDVLGLDVGSYFTKNDGLAAWTFSGFNGATQVFSLENSQAFGRLTMNWTDITRFSIQSASGPAASSFDNIEVAYTQVNEPLSMTLMSIFVLLGCRLRSKNTR